MSAQNMKVVAFDFNSDAKRAMLNRLQETVMQIESGEVVAFVLGEITKNKTITLSKIGAVTPIELLGLLTKSLQDVSKAMDES